MLVFLKLGGSLITEKSAAETARPDAFRRIAHEIRRALDAEPTLSLVVGHGSGSFGHSVARQYATHLGVHGADAWRGFAKVALAAARLNVLVLEALDAAGVPVFRVQPSASAVCRDGELIELALGPLERALQEGLVPLVYGDVAVDTQRGGSIISTEDIFSYLALRLKPDRILLAGDYSGVLDGGGHIVPRLTRHSLSSAGIVIGGSEHPDVTGGMASKVDSMLRLCESIPGLTCRIFSGDNPDTVRRALVDPDFAEGTLLVA